MAALGGVHPTATRIIARVTSNYRVLQRIRAASAARLKVVYCRFRYADIFIAPITTAALFSMKALATMFLSLCAVSIIGHSAVALAHMIRWRHAPLQFGLGPPSEPFTFTDFFAFVTLTRQ